MPRTKKIEPIVPTDEVKEDIAVVDETEAEIESKTDDTTAAEETVKETITEEIKKEDSLSDALNKLANAVSESIEKKASKKVEQTKSRFKLGFWGYLGLAVVVKGAVEIAKAVAESKRPRR